MERLNSQSAIYYYAVTLVLHSSCPGGSVGNLEIVDVGT